MRGLICLFLLLCMAWECCAQREIDVEHIVSLSGVSSEEELDGEDVERLTGLLRHPLKINVASRSSLLESGLFSPYQAASLLDYRSRNGDILSCAELASVDGFGTQYAALVCPFISFYSRNLPGAAAEDTLRVSSELSIRGGARLSDGLPEWNYGLKYELAVGDRWRLSLGATRGRTDKTAFPSLYSASLLYEFRRLDGNVVVGDFNARSGQGLAIWNGMFTTGLSEPSAFMKKASGISQVASFTGSAAYTGVAAEFGFSQLIVSAALAFPGIKQARSRPDRMGMLPLVSVRWLSRAGSVGVNAQALMQPLVKDVRPRASYVRTSADAALCFNGVNVFGEAAYDWIEKRPDVLAGVDFTAGESVRVAALASYSRMKSHRVASSAVFRSGSGRNHSYKISADAIRYPVAKSKNAQLSLQVKAVAEWEWKSQQGLRIRAKVADRFRTWGDRHRLEFRADADIPAGAFVMTPRFHFLRCKAPSYLGFFDLSYGMDVFKIRIRAGVFFVDHWEDRIYAYEYDAPYSFNVPAYYGRGVWTSAFVSWKIARWVRLYSRVSYIAYPFMEQNEKKPGRAELKLQMMFRF